MTFFITVVFCVAHASASLQSVYAEKTCTQPPVNLGGKNVDVSRDRATFENCTIVLGNLIIANYETGDGSFDFLSQIREVSGFVMFLNNQQLLRIPLPNLVLIRGERRYEPVFENPYPWKPCALCLIDNRGLRTLGLSRLADISNGAVTIANSPHLCYAKLVNWTDILAPGFQLQHRDVSSDANCSLAECHSGCAYNNCFGDTIEECHNLTRIICKSCEDRCLGPTQNDCCNQQCVGGCHSAGANNQCFACRHVNDEGRCMESCSGSTKYDPILRRRVRNPDGKVRLQNQCVLRCPSYMALDGDACVTGCSEGQTEVNGVCEKCAAKSCPVYCDGNGAQPEVVRAGADGVAEFINARNINRFINCTHVNFNLRILRSTFLKSNKVIELPLADLQNALRHIQLVNGYVEIDVHGVPDLDSFEFLQNLREIRGRSLLDDQYALSLGIESLKFLGLRSLTRISNGNVRTFNSAACSASTVTPAAWSRLFANATLQKYESRAKCPQYNLSRCSEGCDPHLGCWGPSDDMCVDCRHFRLQDRCVINCGQLELDAKLAGSTSGGGSPPYLFYGNNVTRTCDRCHPQCAGGCVGPVETDCFSCRNAMDGSACVATCPALNWKADNGSCLPCHEHCVAGCSGPSNTLGEGGCYQCYRTVQHRNSTIGKYCASKTDSCEPGYVAMHTSGVKSSNDLSQTQSVQSERNHSLAASMAGQQLICMPCPAGCIQCAGSPPTCEICEFARVEPSPTPEALAQIQAKDAYWHWITQIRNSNFVPIRPAPGASANMSQDWHSSASVNNDTQSNLASIDSSTSTPSASIRQGAFLRSGYQVIDLLETANSGASGDAQTNAAEAQDADEVLLSDMLTLRDAANTWTSTSPRGGECVPSLACPSNFFLLRAPIKPTCLDDARLLEVQLADSVVRDKEYANSSGNATLPDSFVVSSQSKVDHELLANTPNCRTDNNLCIPCDVHCKGGCDGFGAHRCFDCLYARLDLEEFVHESVNHTDRPIFECVSECPARKPFRLHRNESRLLSNGEMTSIKVAFCSELESAFEQIATSQMDMQRLIIMGVVIFLCLCTLGATAMYVSYSMKRRARHKLRAACIAAELTGLGAHDCMDDDFGKGDDDRHKLHKCKSGSIKSKSNLDIKDSCYRTVGSRAPVGPAPDMAKLNLIRTSELLLGSSIGSGAFGTVHRGLWIPLTASGENIKIKIPVAIKVLNEPTAREKMDFLEEARVMSSVSHYCCVRVLAVCMAQQMQLISELLPLGCLLEYVRTHRDVIGSKHMLTWATQIAMGMAYLEERRIVHRDLAARNVLVQSPKQVKITDFGLAKLLDEDSDYIAEGGKLPIKWLALESILHRVFNHKTDVWSFGVTMWEILTYGARPYGNVRAVELSILLEKGERLPQPEICTIDTYLLMVKCWMLDAGCRPSFSELVDDLARMCHDPGRYLMIPGDELMRLPGATDYTRDEVILNTLNELSSESIADFRVVPAEEYLRPNWRPAGSGSTSSPSAQSAGVGFVMDAARAAALSTSNSDGSHSLPSAMTNWCYELAGGRGGDDVVDGALPLIAIGNEQSLASSNDSPAQLATTTVAKHASPSIPRVETTCADDEPQAAQHRAAASGADLLPRATLRHAQSTESCPLPNLSDCPLGRFSALELEKERRRRDKFEAGDRAIRRVSKMRATRYSLDPLEVRRKSAILERDVHAADALLETNGNGALQPRACSSVKAIDTYGDVKCSDSYVLMTERAGSQQSDAERVPQPQPQPISVHVRLAKQGDCTHSRSRSRVEEDMFACDRYVENECYIDRVVDENEEDARVSPTMLSPVFSVSTPPSSAHTAHNPEYFDSTEQPSASPLDRIPRSRTESEMATSNKSYFLLPQNDTLPTLAEKFHLLDRVRHSGGVKAKPTAAKMTLPAC